MELINLKIAMHVIVGTELDGVVVNWKSDVTEELLKETFFDRDNRLNRIDCGLEYEENLKKSLVSISDCM